MSLANRYTAGRDDRAPYLDRAFSTAELSIPALLPRGSEDCNKINRLQLPTPFQSAGARFVQVMAAKMAMGLFSPGLPFARHKMDLATERQLNKDDLSTWRKGLSDIDDAIHSYFEGMSIRPQLDECLKQLLIAGNVLLILDAEGKGARVIKLTNYVCQRANQGTFETVTVKEMIRPISLPEVVRQKIAQEQGPEALESDKPIPIYTGVEWNPSRKRYKVWQECMDLMIPGSHGEYRKDNCPFIPLWLLPVHGEDYGYGYLTSYLGDLVSLEGLSEAFTVAAAAAAKVIFALAEEAGIDEDDIANAPNLSVLRFNPEHLQAIQLDKRVDLATTREGILDIRQSLARASLENSSFQRNAERVTREEVLMMAEELETVLVGGYALLASTLQRPIVNFIKWKLGTRLELPPKDMVRVSIVTGMEALGRSAELQRLDQFLVGSQQTLGPDVVAQRLDVSNYMERRAAALGFNSDGLIKDDETVQAQLQQQQAADVLGRLGPQLIQQLGGQSQENPEQPQ